MPRFRDYPQAAVSQETPNHPARRSAKSARATIGAGAGLPPDVPAGRLLPVMTTAPPPHDDPRYEVRHSDAEWRERLDPTQYRVARHAATEPAFTGRYWD